MYLISEKILNYNGAKSAAEVTRLCTEKFK